VRRRYTASQPAIQYLNRLTVKQLQALVALDDSGGLTRAALHLGISQPALSNRLREVERLTGTSIFDRAGHRLHFTSLGMILLNAARVVLDELIQAEFHLSQSGAQSRPVIRIEVRGYNLHEALCPFMAQLMLESDSPLLEVKHDASRLPLEALIAGDVDLTIALGSYLRRGLQLHKLFDDELVAVIPHDHHLAARDFLTPADFVDEMYITFDAVLERGQEVERFFLPAGIFPRHIHCVGSSDYVCGLVANGCGISILSRWAVNQHSALARLAIKSLNRDGIMATWHAVLRQSDAENKSLTDLCRQIPGIFRSN
jgi:LysR family transcriptional regulator, regulator for metE and metH